MNAKSLLLALALSVFALPALALDVPEVMHLQAYLTTPDGTPVNDTVTVTFRFYEGQEEPSLLFEEVQSVDVVNGVFVAGVGELDGLSAVVFETTEPVFFEMEINGEVLEPRYPIRSVPYAMWAANALDIDEIREALASELLPTCEDGQLLSYAIETESWACVDPGAGPQGEQGSAG